MIHHYTFCFIYQFRYKQQTRSLLMSHQGFKNLLKSSTQFDESFQQLLKRSDQHRKSAKISLDYLQIIHKHYQNQQTSFQRLFLQYWQNPLRRDKRFTKGYEKLFDTLKNVNQVNSNFSRKMRTNIKEIVQASTTLLNNYSNIIISFQSIIRSYVKNQQGILQLGKKYFKSHKSMIGSLQAYKQSFTNAKLVYNIDERIKRYNNCEMTFKQLMEELNSIQDKSMIIDQIKRQLAENYRNIQRQFHSALKIVGSKIITFSEYFSFEFNQMIKSIKNCLDECSIEGIIASLQFYPVDQSNQQYFYKVNISQGDKYPYFLVGISELKPQYYSNVPKLFQSYLLKLGDSLETRKKIVRFINQFLQNYFKQYEKYFLSGIFQLCSNFDKLKKKISQIYGSQHFVFLKTFTSIFEQIGKSSEQTFKQISLKLKSIQSLIQQQSKNSDSFFKQLKSAGQKLTKRKDSKKTPSKNALQNEQDGDIESNKIYMQQKAHNILVMLDGFYSKINQSEAHLILHYKIILEDLQKNYHRLSNFSNNFYCNQYEQQNFSMNMQKYQRQFDQIFKAKINFFNELSFSILVKQKLQPVSFDSQISKIQEFKKLKKPLQADSSPLKKKQSIIEVKNGLVDDVSPQQIKKQYQQSLEKNGERLQSLTKYEQFLTTKIVLNESQKYVDNFKCGLSDKINLSGRLFITNQRLVFYSKFNPNNVFFGETLLQIPKVDIIKIQKRQSVIIFDNSLCVTTVNGEVLFTSFFSRNEAYDCICNALQISLNEDFMFEAQQQNKKEEVLSIQKEQEDDITEEKINQRSSQIEQMLEIHDYVEIHNFQYTFPGLNAFKFFKFTDSSDEISYNRKNYQSFSLYFKQVLGHRQITIQDWSPSIKPCLNSSNIKGDCPLTFSKFVKATIPVGNSGIPLMPKTAILMQTMKLHFISKDKYIIETKVKNAGIPYCDYFNIYYKKIVQTIAQNKCRVRYLYIIQFVEKTLMKSVIQSKSVEQSKITIKKLDTQIKKYLKAMQDRIKKSQNKCGAESSDENIFESSKEIQETNERELQLIQQLQASQQNRQNEKKWLIISVILNLLLIVLLIKML